MEVEAEVIKLHNVNAFYFIAEQTQTESHTSKQSLQQALTTFSTNRQYFQGSMQMPAGPHLLPPP